MRHVRLLLLALASPLVVAACGRVIGSQETPDVEHSAAAEGGGSFGSSGSSPSSSSGATNSSSSSGGSRSSGSSSGGSSGSSSGDRANSADDAPEADADSAEADASQTAADRVSRDGANSADQASDGDADSAEGDAPQTGVDRVSGDGANSADQASDADADSAACIILASNYDQPCTVDSDCTGVHTGDYCSVPTSPYGPLLCPQSPISVAALPRYRADVSQTPLGQAILTRMFVGSSCGAARAPVYCCRQGTCQGGPGACM